MKYAINKTFSHPVLREGSLDYENSAFQPIITSEIVEGGTLIVDVTFMLSEGCVQELISQGKATYVVMVYCSMTHTRTFYKTREKNIREELPAVAIHGRVEVSAFIIAEQKIDDFFSSNMNKEFGGVHFTITSGDVLAVAPPHIFIVESPNIPIGAVIEVVLIADRSSPNFSVSLEHEIIRIEMGSEEKLKFDFARDNKRLLPHIFLGFYVPTIAEALRLMSKDDGLDEDRKWSRVIRSACDNADPPVKIMNLEDGDFLNEAQRLLRYPLEKLESPATGGRSD